MSKHFWVELTIHVGRISISWGSLFWKFYKHLKNRIKYNRVIQKKITYVGMQIRCG